MNLEDAVKQENGMNQENDMDQEDGIKHLPTLGELDCMVTDFNNGYTDGKNGRSPRPTSFAYVEGYVAAERGLKSGRIGG